MRTFISHSAFRVSRRVALFVCVLAVVSAGCQGQSTVGSGEDDSNGWSPSDRDAASDAIDDGDSMRGDADADTGLDTRSNPDAGPEADGATGPRVRSSSIEFSQVSAGRHHTCGVTVAGELRCWGVASDPDHEGDFLDYDQAVPPDGDDWAAVSAGNRMSCAITTGGRARCWGQFYDADQQWESSMYTDIHVGHDAACGIKGDQSVECWALGDTDASPAQPDAPRTNPPDLDFVDISIGEYNTCGVFPDGGVDCWGTDQDDRRVDPSDRPGSTFQTVSVGESSACALDQDGLVTCWGLRAYGLRDPPAVAFEQFDAGELYACGVTTTGDIRCWGTGEDLQRSRYGKGVPPPEENFAQVSAGNHHTCAIDQTDTVRCWGSNRFNEADPP